MNNYLIKHSKHPFKLLLKYNKTGRLYAYEASEIQDDQLDYFLKNLPVLESKVKAFKNVGLIVLQQIEELTFETFWELYDYKVGNKTRAIKLFNALSEAEKQEAISGVKRYNAWLQTQTTAKLYPETFLNQKRWMN